VDDLRRRLSGQRNDEKPQLRALRSHASIPERLSEYARGLGIGPQQIAEFSRPIRRRQRPDRDAVMYLLWRAGRCRLGQIAPHFGVSDAAVSQACRRVERRLNEDPKFRRTVETAAKTDNL
jgi:chromosomal replication initiation ATPase DnaA